MLQDFRFHHIGVAVYDIDKTAMYYTEAGYNKTETIVDPIQNVQICFLTKENMPMVELLAPVDNSSPVIKTLEKSGVSPYHMCYEVESIDDAIKLLKRKKFIPIIKPVSACALCNKRICFLYNKEVGLIEILETK